MRRTTASALLLRVSERRKNGKTLTVKVARDKPEKSVLADHVVVNKERQVNRRNDENQA
jgi:hypothetical protein